MWLVLWRMFYMLPGFVLCVIFPFVSALDGADEYTSYDLITNRTAYDLIWYGVVLYCCLGVALYLAIVSANPCTCDNAQCKQSLHPHV